MPSATNRTAELQFRLGLIEQSVEQARFLGIDWPNLAAQMLADGFDGPTLRILAGEGDRTDSDTLRQLVANVCKEMNYRLPDSDEAIRVTAVALCVQAASGQISIPSAARHIIGLTTPRPTPVQKELRDAFVEVWDWDDLPQYRSEIELALRKSIDRYASGGDAELDEQIRRATSTITNRA
jgi:hypothetical protein